MTICKWFVVWSVHRWDWVVLVCVTDGNRDKYSSNTGSRLNSCSSWCCMVCYLVCVVSLLSL